MKTPPKELLTWEHINRIAKQNIFVDAGLVLKEDTDMTPEECLIAMVLIQDDALKNIETLQANGWEYEGIS